jgi:hypothetical protein
MVGRAARGVNGGGFGARTAIAITSNVGLTFGQFSSERKLAFDVLRIIVSAQESTIWSAFKASTSCEKSPMEGLPRLTPLPGTAPAGTWCITNADMADADARLAIFAIVVYEGQTLKPLGTGFYLQPHGGFATAAHVALHAQRRLAAAPGSVGIARTLPSGKTRFLPIWKFFIHETADIAFGVPAAEFVDDATGQAVTAKDLSLTTTSPDIGAVIATYAYPLHRFVEDGKAGGALQLQPDFYDGRLEEFYAERGPSVKLSPPYYRTSIHLYGASSGGPVFFDGHVFGIASTSFDGEEDITFVTPASALLEIHLPIKIGEGDDRSTEPLSTIVARGQLAMREAA